ncbi:MAG TPA: flagellin [Candidatus Syntrophoarchaeum butanivorans]|uniref:Flagellin n=1 Tax=Candidatus Syntropharchaeum butanivorans TaxID=1839936 RepID=A0A7C0X3G5_9EURY|nr:flagellin [Candidatus Syntrophoarchaeum butanivorans]
MPSVYCLIIPTISFIYVNIHIIKVNLNIIFKGGEIIMQYMRKITFIKDERAQAGIGTLIIFIAMVLVAAVAAAVLIQTSGVLQQKAQETGQQTIQEVSSNIEIVGIVGHRVSATANDFETINITVKPMAGSGPIDLYQMVIAIQNETKRIESIKYIPDTQAGSQTSTQFYVVELRDDDDSLNASTTTTTVINAGDLINIVLKPGTAMDFPTREPVRIEIKPEHGAAVIKDLITPPSYSVERNVVLFP